MHFQTTFSLISGADNLALMAPFLETFASACGSAASIFRVIDRASKIDSMSSQGDKLSAGVQGNIVFKKVNFSYPSRPDVQVCLVCYERVENEKITNEICVSHRFFVTWSWKFTPANQWLLLAVQEMVNPRVCNSCNGSTIPTTAKS